MTRKITGTTPRDLGEIIRAQLETFEPDDTLPEVGNAALSILSTSPDAVVALAHQKLHAFPFKDVPTCWRRLYEEATLWKVVTYCETVEYADADKHDSESPFEDWITKVVAMLDMAKILTGGPGRSELIQSILDKLDSILLGDEEQDSNTSQQTKKRKRTSFMGNGYPHSSPGSPLPSTFPSAATATASPILNHPIPRLPRPSLETFHAHIHTFATPLILTDTLTHWPALTRWPDPRYWLRRMHGGRRLVPVETGRSYTDEGWGQKIIPFGEFLRQGVLQPGGREAGPGAGAGPETAYLAQHDLLSQVPALRADVAIPDYCYLSPPPVGLPASAATAPAPPSPSLSTASTASSSSDDTPATDPTLNIWLGPANTISPAHTDPHANLLAQVFGRKHIRLYPPDETARMYPMSSGEGLDGSGESGVDMHNTSRVDVGLEMEFAADAGAAGAGAQEERRDRQRGEFPLFARARYVEGVLGPGEVLYIPRGWWHYVRSLEGSCSVSFWWD